MVTNALVKALSCPSIYLVSCDMGKEVPRLDEHSESLNVLYLVLFLLDMNVLIHMKYTKFSDFIWFPMSSTSAF